MKILKNSFLLKGIAVATLSTVLTTPVFAHHSYAIYDIDNKVKRTGILKELNFVQPHINLVIESTCKDGSVETWKIVSKSTRLWDNDGHDREFAEIGDTVSIIGWPARNGKTDMALSEVHSEKVKMVIRDEIHQRGSRDNLPEETITPDECA